MTRARSIAVVATAIGAALVAPAVARPISSEHPPPKRPEVAYRFVSIPDLFNADLGDVRGQHGWDAGDPNSMNPYYEEAIDVVLDAVEAEDPAFVAVAGDLVEGHWGEDLDNTGIFGPVGTEAERLRAITAAGDLYYGQWRDRFARRGLTVYPAVGDHEIGDDLGGQPMDQRWPAGTFRHRAVPTYKAVWARNFTTARGNHRYPLRPLGTQWEDTAYAVRPDDETLLVSVDVFRYNDRGVQPIVGGGQLRWLRGLLTDARRRGVDNVIVQGHVPVLGPVRAARSGRLAMLGGERSRFWRLLRAKGVDMYLAGEVHAVTAIDDGVLQVTHGGLIAWGGVNYLLVTVYDDGTVKLRLKDFALTATDRDHWLWQTSWKRQPLSVTYARGTRTVATGRYGRAGAFTRRTGLFKPYRPR